MRELFVNKVIDLTKEFLDNNQRTKLKEILTEICLNYQYVIEIGDIVKYPEKLDSDGDGNHDFNIGEKSKYAYPII